MVDVIVILLIIIALFRGMRYGFLRLLLSSVGFLLGLFAGFWLAKIASAHMFSQMGKLVVALGIELILALGLSTAGEVIAIRLSKKVKVWHLGEVNKWLGSVLEVVFILFAVWLVASGLMNVQSYNIGRSVRESLIIRNLDSLLPQPPDFIAQIEKFVSPNGFPNVFIGREPEHTTIATNPPVNDKIVQQAEKSVVKIEGRGCGGIVEGSGFVAGSGIVVTNAHVVAGVGHPKVIDASGTYAATPIWFDANTDVAILKVNGLRDPELPVSLKQLSDGDSAVVLGFPGGGPLTVVKAVIIDEVRAVGQNIYNSGRVSRDIYELQADIEPGNSGGPVIASDGSVAGVVFAKGVSQPNIGYALLTRDINNIISQAEAQQTAVGVGSCASD